MFCEPRVDDFKGSYTDYTRYLETQLRLARRQLETIQRHVTPPVSLVSLEPTSERPEGQAAPDGEINQTEWTFIQATPQTLVQEECSNQKPRWHVELDAMLTDIPPANRWMEKRAKAEIPSSAQNRSVLTTLLGGSLNFNPLVDRATHICSPTSHLNILLEFANVYGHVTRKTQKHAQFASTVGVFQQLIFVSLCVILEASGTPSDSIDSLMRPCFAADTQKSLERIRCGARWANQCIASLSKSDWGLRSTEIFLLCGRRVPVYGRFSDSTKSSLGHFTGQLDASQYTMKYTEVQDWLPYHIPCIIKALVGDALTLHEICNYLEYPVTSIETLTNLCESYKRCILAENLPSPRPLNEHGRRSEKPRTSAHSRAGKKKAGSRRKANLRKSNFEIILAELPKQTEQQNDGAWLCRSPSGPERPQDPPSMTSPPCFETPQGPAGGASVTGE